MGNKLSVEELMRNRYKLLSDYPGCAFPVGTILYVDEHGELFGKTEGYSPSITKIMEKDADKFRHLIKRLYWADDRNIDELPAYVKWDKTLQIPEAGMVEKVEFWEMAFYRWCAKVPSQVNSIGCGYFDPATEQEYNDYINSKSV